MGHSTYECKKNANASVEKSNNTQRTRPQTQAHRQQVYKPKVTNVTNQIYVSNVFATLHALGTNAPFTKTISHNIAPLCLATLPTIIPTNLPSTVIDIFRSNIVIVTMQLSHLLA